MNTPLNPRHGTGVALLASVLFGVSSHRAVASGEADWEWRNPLPHGAGLWQLVEGNGRLIATGRAGTIQTTEDGATWRLRESGTRQHLLSAAAANQTVVAVGADGTMVTSTDSGETWSVNHLKAGTWTTVVHAGGQWLAVGSTIAISSDGLTWTEVGSPAPGILLHHPVWTGTRWVVAGVNSVFLSPDGVTWQRGGLDLPPFTQVVSMVWTGSQLLASTGSQLLASPDGLAWNTDAPEGPQWIHELVCTGTQTYALSSGSVAYLRSFNGDPWRLVDFSSINPSLGLTTAAAHGKDVLIAGSHGDLINSADYGGTWMPVSSGLEGSIHALRRFAGRWVAVGSDGGVSSSADGIQWEPYSSGTLAHLECVAWHDGMWVAGGRVESGPSRHVKQFGLFTSPDGKQWTDRSFSNDPYPGWNALVHTVLHTGERWMAVASSAVLTSVDTVTWEVHPVGHITLSAAWNGSRLITVDVPPEDDPGLVRYTDDAGKTWRIISGIGGQPRAITWSGSQFLILSFNDLHTSETGDAGTWKRQALPPDVICRAVYADQGSIVLVGSQWGPALGESAAVLISRDGVSWTRCELPTAPGLNSIDKAGSLYVAAGDDGVVLTSGDALTWTRWQTPTTHELYASGWNGQELLVLGEGGTILAHREPTAIVPWSGIGRRGEDDATLRLTWQAIPGRTYLIVTSTDLRPPWTRWSDSVRPAVEEMMSIEIRDADLPASRERFFRLHQRP
ncbi:MAG: hypothetical protein ACKV19_19740 [Verrucomicrobiales bacterium]